MSDLSALLGDDKKETTPTGKSKTFAGIIQRGNKSSTLPPRNRIDEKNEEKLGIDLGGDTDAFNKDKFSYTGTGGNFGLAEIKETTEPAEDNFAKSDFFSNEMKKSETMPVTITGLLGNFSRRKTQQITTESITGIKEENVGSKFNKTPQGEEETSYVPSLPTTTKRDRRFRDTTGIKNPSPDKEKVTDESTSEQIPTISFRPFDKNQIKEEGEKFSVNELTKAKSEIPISVKNDSDITFTNENPRQDMESKIQSTNVTDVKAKIDKEFYENQISGLKKLLEEEKRRYEKAISDERELNRKKDTEMERYIESLKDRQKGELSSLEATFREREKSLLDDIKRLRSEFDKEMQNERERLGILHKSELDSQENNFKRILDQQKKNFEDQNDTLRKQLQQQIEFNKLANKVEVSSKQIEEILQKFQMDKEKIYEVEKNSIENKEKFLFDLEEKLKETEKSLVLEKEVIQKIRKDAELRELEKKRENQEEKARIEKEILRLQELQNSLKVLEFGSKEKYEREKLELTQKHSEMKTELESMKNDYHQRLNDLEYQRKMLDEEKKYFELHKEETFKNLEIQKANISERKKHFYEEEKEVKARIKVMQEKEFYLSQKYEEFERVRGEIEEKEKKIEKDRKDLLLAAKRIEEGIRSLDDRNRVLDQEREEIVKKFNEIENEKAILNSEKLKVEQEKAEIRLRLQSIDMLRIKYVTSNSSNPGLALASDIRSNTFTSPFPPNPNAVTNQFSMTAKAPLMSGSNKSQLDLKQSTALSQTSNMKKSINADEYFQTLKNKLGQSKIPVHETIHGNNFNNYLYQEKEYLRKSNDLYENSIKKEYEKMSQQYFNKKKDDEYNYTGLSDFNTYQTKDKLCPLTETVKNRIEASSNPQRINEEEKIEIGIGNFTKQNVNEPSNQHLQLDPKIKPGAKSKITSNNHLDKFLDDFEEIVDSSLPKKDQNKNQGKPLNEEFDY